MANLSDERLTKTAGGSNRSDRANEDSERINKDGTALTAQERRNALREDWVQEILPSPPAIPGFHTCWLSTTNSMDPIYKRVQHGYTPVMSSEVAGFAGNSNIMSDGEFKGCIACNEMLLFKVAEQTYQDLMHIFHYDMPQEQERNIYEKVHSGSEVDSNGKTLDLVEGDFNSLGRGRAQPSRFN